MVLLGDWNCSIGSGPEHWGRQTDDVAQLTARDRKLLDLLQRCELLPVHGMNGHRALFTCQGPAFAKRTPGMPESYGRRERDFVFVRLAGAAALPLQPRMGDCWEGAHVHRVVSAMLTLPAAGAAPPPPLPPRPVRPIVPEYADRRAYGAVASGLEGVVPQLDQLLETQAPAQQLYDAIQGGLKAVSKDNCSRAQHQTPPPRPPPPLPLFNPNASQAAPHRARRALPANVVDLLRVARKTLTRSCFLRRKGHLAALAAADAMRLRYKQQRNLARAAIRRFERSQPLQYARFLERTHKHANALWHKRVKRDGADSFSSEPLKIPPNEDGRPEDTFPTAARALFATAPPPPPAIRPESGDRWSRHIPRPRIPIPAGGALARPFSWEEVWWTLFGAGRHAPPTPCDHSVVGEPGATTCTRCMEEKAQFEEAEKGRAERLGHSINTSVAAGLDGVPAELLSWARHKDFDPSDDAKDGGATTAMRKAYCRAFAALFNDMLSTGVVPKDFTAAVLTLLRKEAKGDEALDFSRFESYRPISCIETSHKVLKLMLTRRLSHFCLAAGLLGPQQAGFSHRLSTEHDIFVFGEAIRRRIEARGGRAWALFADIKRAYDTVDHAAMVKVLETIGIAPSVCNLVKALLADASFRLEINGGLSVSIPLKVGLPQGDPLSPVLFLLFIESLCKELDAVDLSPQAAGGAGGAAARLPPARRGLLTVGQLLRDLLYADDVVLLSATYEDLVRARGVMEEWGAAWGMVFNPKAGKTEYLFFCRDLEDRHTPPSVELALKHKKKDLPAGITLFPPVPADCAPIPHAGGAGWAAASSYRYLGVTISPSLNWAAHWRKSCGPLNKFNALFFHRSSIMGRMAVSRNLQMRKMIASPYAWGALSVPQEVVSYWDDFRHVSGSGILGYYAPNTSKLLVDCLSATLSTGALRLRERLRLYMQLLTHCSRRAPAGFPRHASIALFDALREERRILGDRAPNSWLKEVAGLLAVADGVMPFPVQLESLQVEWSFQIATYLRPYVTGVTYFAARQAAVSDGGILPQDSQMGPDPPRTAGSLRAAASLTFGLTAPPDIFRPGARPMPLSELGPGLHHPITLATEWDSYPVRLALLGNAALRKAPWVATGKDGKLLPIPVPPGTTPPPANHGSASGCSLCNDTDGVFHGATSCRHPAMVAARTPIVRDVVEKLLPWLVEELRRLVQCPGDGGTPLDPAHTAEELAALAGIPSLLAGGGGAALSNEFCHILYRLVTASPWPRRAAQAGAHLASAIGALFDAVIAAPLKLRGLANRWVRWARIAIERLAKARWAALVAETAAPTLPRPPAWIPPAAVQAAARDGPRAVLKFRQDRAPAIGVTPFTWYVRCNKPALEFLLDRARLDPTIAPRIPREAPAAGAFVSKDTLVQLLCDLGLFQADLDRLRAPAPA